MTSSNTTPSKQTTRHHRWQTFIEFTLSLEAGSTPLVTDLVVRAVETLKWPAAPLEQLELALIKAIQNAVEQNHVDDLDPLLMIRVFVLEGGEAAQTGGGPGEPEEDLSSAEPVQPARSSPSRGWGFFLVQKHGDASQAVAGEGHHLIELFLYQESCLLC
ncbi:MAG: hypothetical protein HS126_34375 [Anaerolineales bacterium]|nr:hypothetical protein [Anaerolineales bacterium]